MFVCVYVCMYIYTYMYQYVYMYVNNMNIYEHNILELSNKTKEFGISFFLTTRKESTKHELLMFIQCVQKKENPSTCRM